MKKEDRSFIIWGSLSYRGGVLRCNGSVRLRVVAAAGKIHEHARIYRLRSVAGSQILNFMS